MTPFCFFSFILFDLLLDYKCAIFLFDRPHGAFDLPQHHFRYIRNGAAKLRDRIIGVKERHIRKVLRREDLCGVMFDSTKHGICDGGCDLHVEHTPCIFCGQFSQSAVIRERHERIEIILCIVRCSFECNTEDCVLQCRRLGIAKGVFQLLNDPLLILGLCLPQGKRLAVAIIGVFDIEYMTKMRTVAAIVDQCDALCTAIDPAVKHSVP